MRSLLLGLLENLVFGAIPAVGFGMLFNVPVRILGWCALGGALGRGTRFLLMQIGIPITWGTLLAAAVVSFLGVSAAQRLRAHPKVFTVAAIIPMIPGVYMFTALMAITQMERQGPTPELLATVLKAGLDATFIVAALAVGLAVPGLYKRRPVV